MIIGIDPGLKGGMAIFSPLTGAIELKVMPSLIEVVALLDWHSVADTVHVVIEKCQSFPKQGIASAFNYGVHYGELLGVIAALGIPHTLVRPAVWTKNLHAGTKDGDPKARSLEAVRRLFPKVNLLATPRCKKPHDGLIDALLLAEYGRRVINGRE